MQKTGVKSITIRMKTWVAITLNAIWVTWFSASGFADVSLPNSTILFVRAHEMEGVPTDGQEDQIWFMSGKTHWKPQQLTYSEGRKIQPKLSPDGRTALFLSGSHTFELDLETKEETRLFAGAQGKYSPSGDRIAFTVRRNVSPDSILHSVRVYDRKSRQSAVIVEGLPSYYYPNWVDESRVAFLELSGETSRIHLFDLKEKKSLGCVSTLPFRIHNLERSPDGRRWAYQSRSEPLGILSRIFVMDFDGTHIQKLYEDSDMYHSSPSWSPDGRFIVFSSGGEGFVSLVIVDIASNRSFKISQGHRDLMPSWGVPIPDVFEDKR